MISATFCSIACGHAQMFVCDAHPRPTSYHHILILFPHHHFLHFHLFHSSPSLTFDPLLHVQLQFLVLHLSSHSFFSDDNHHQHSRGRCKNGTFTLKHIMCHLSMFRVNVFHFQFHQCIVCLKYHMIS